MQGFSKLFEEDLVRFTGDERNLMDDRFGTGKFVQKIDTVKGSFTDMDPSLLRLSYEPQQVAVDDGEVVSFFMQVCYNTSNRSLRDVECLRCLDGQGNVKGK